MHMLAFQSHTRALAGTHHALRIHLGSGEALIRLSEWTSPHDGRAPLRGPLSPSHVLCTSGKSSGCSLPTRDTSPQQSPSWRSPETPRQYPAYTITARQNGSALHPQRGRLPGRIQQPFGLWADLVKPVNMLLARQVQGSASRNIRSTHSTHCPHTCQRWQYGHSLAVHRGQSPLAIGSQSLSGCRCTHSVRRAVPVLPEALANSYDPDTAA
jgi:hypothetical protein